MDEKYKLRVKFIKSRDLKWISQLDITRAIERGLRRAHIPVAFSQGFSPHPKISYGSALPVGISSKAEYFDIELTEAVKPDNFIKIVNKNLSSFLQVIEALTLSAESKKLGQLQTGATYEIKVKAGQPSASKLIKLASKKSLTNNAIKIKSENRQVLFSEISNIIIIKHDEIILIRVNAKAGTGPKRLISEIEQGLGLIENSSDVERVAQYTALKGELVDLIDPRLLGGSNDRRSKRNINFNR